MGKPEVITNWLFSKQRTHELTIVFLWFPCSIWCNSFSWPILRQIKRWKKFHFFDQNHGLTPLEKSQFFDFLDFLFLVKEGVFSFWYTVQHIFFALFCFKYIDGKTSTLRLKPLTHTFGKIPIFRLFYHVIFIVRKNVFSF